MRKPAKKVVKKVVVLQIAPTTYAKSIEGEIAALTAMQQTEGWRIVLRILNENIEYLQEGILTKRDPETLGALSDTEVDELRIKRSLSIELRSTPENYIKKFTQSSVPEKSYDPYA